MSKKELLFTLSKDLGDFTIEFFPCGGPGGQNVNRRSTGARIRHPASGAVAECREERHQLANRKRAFTRLVESPKFQAWHKMKVGYALRGIADMEREMNRKLDEMMAPENLKVEVFDEELQKWIEIK